VTPKSDRATIATGLRNALGANWAVFASPPETPSVPCVVIRPGSPYRELNTYRLQRMRLRLEVILQRALGAEALDVIDDAIDDVLTALDALSISVGWSGAEPTGLVEVNGVEYLTATIDIDVV
jgi:hypothetical protein